MKFELYRLIQPEGVTFRHWDREKHEVTLVVIPVARWDKMGRPVTITAEVTPGPVFVESEPAPAGWDPKASAAAWDRIAVGGTEALEADR